MNGDFSSKLDKILSNPAMMAQIKSLADTMTEDGEAKTPPPTEPTQAAPEPEPAAALSLPRRRIRRRRCPRCFRLPREWRKHQEHTGAPFGIEALSRRQKKRQNRQNAEYAPPCRNGRLFQESDMRR